MHQLGSGLKPCRLSLGVRKCPHHWQELGNKGWSYAEETAHEAVWFGKADGLVITGRNEAETLEWLQRVKRAAPDVPIWAGGGATPKNISRLLMVADGVIVATAAKAGCQLLNPVDRQAAEALRTASAEFGEGVMGSTCRQHRA